MVVGLCCSPDHTAIADGFVGTMEGLNKPEKTEQERCSHACQAAEKQMSVVDGCRRH